MDEFSIRKVTNMEEIHGIVEVQRQAWQMSDLEIVATFEMKAVSSFGVVLIATDKDDKIIGFIYALPHSDPSKHYSHMMATLPQWQGKGVGFAMKKVHRDLALKSGNIKSIIWTVDPLLTNNSYLNFSKLGGVCSTYYPNYYGDPEEVGIYKGVPTDRFLLEWPIQENRVAKRMTDFKADRISKDNLLDRSPVINKIVDERYVTISEAPKSNSFSVEVPGDYLMLKTNSIDIAIEWRLKFREICLSYFNLGWEISDFHSFISESKRRNYYEFTLKK